MTDQTDGGKSQQIVFSNGKGTISIVIEGITFFETERYRQIVSNLISNGALNVKNGGVTMHFDGDGLLRELRFDIVKKIRPEKIINENRQKDGHLQAEAQQLASERAMR